MEFTRNDETSRLTRMTYRYSIKSPDRTEQSERIASHTASHCRKNFIFSPDTHTTRENQLVLITCIIEPREDYSYGFWASLLQRRQRKQSLTALARWLAQTKPKVFSSQRSFLSLSSVDEVPSLKQWSQSKSTTFVNFFFVGLRSSNHRFFIKGRTGCNYRTVYDVHHPPLLQFYNTGVLEHSIKYAIVDSTNFESMLCKVIDFPESYNFILLHDTKVLMHIILEEIPDTLQAFYRVKRIHVTQSMRSYLTLLLGLDTSIFFPNNFRMVLTCMYTSRHFSFFYRNVVGIFRMHTIVA